jgi:acetyl-CoA C-acetyltransferase
MFSDLCEVYEERYGLDYRHLGAISANNFKNAKRNANAQTRTWAFGENSFKQDDEANPVIEGWMRKQDCGQVTDGSACVILASEEYAKDYAQKRGLDLDSLARIKGWGHTTAALRMDTKLNQPSNNDYLFPATRKAITDAYQRAGISGPEHLDAIETHDCFSITEYMAIEHFGLSAPGEAWKVVESESFTAEGTLPINPSGGLIGLGHPVGATGVRMMLDASRQVTDKAADSQVGGAKNVATYNVGGSATTNVSFVVGVE